METRYCIMKDPCDDWIVWDSLVDQPAEFDGHDLIGLSAIRAETVCKMLNKIEEMRRKGCRATLLHVEAD